MAKEKMDKCKFHPNRFAHVRCKACMIPLCDDCKIVTNEGVFCSEECHEKTRDFMERVQTTTPHYKGPSLFKKLLGLVFIVLLLVVIAVILSILDIVTLPGVNALRDIIGF